MNRKGLTRNYDVRSETSSCSDSSDYEENCAESVSAAGRMPTRRPDPNVSNRNALMARENRRRKKEYVGTLEKELSNAKKANKQLQRTIKKQAKLMEKIESERNYFKNILANKSEIQHLVATLRNAPLRNSPRCSPTNSLSSGVDVMDSNFNDYKSFDNNNWGLLGINSPLHTAGDIPSDSESLPPVVHIKHEHNYFHNSLSSLEEETNAGICLHINGGKMSLEFCPTCHQNSKLGDNLLASI